MPMSDSAVLNAGERLALQCAVVKGGLPLAVTWSKDGQLIAVNSNNNGGGSSSGIGAGTTSMTTTNVRLVNDFTASLTVESLTGHHAGLYICRAANEGGRAEAAVHVVVQGTTWNHFNRSSVNDFYILDISFHYKHDRRTSCHHPTV